MSADSAVGLPTKKNWQPHRGRRYNAKRRNRRAGSGLWRKHTATTQMATVACANTAYQVHFVFATTPCEKSYVGLKCQWIYSANHVGSGTSDNSLMEGNNKIKNIQAASPRYGEVIRLNACVWQQSFRMDRSWSYLKGVCN